MEQLNVHYTDEISKKQAEFIYNELNEGIKNFNAFKIAKRDNIC